MARGVYMGSACACARACVFVSGRCKCGLKVYAHGEMNASSNVSAIAAELVEEVAQRAAQQAEQEEEGEAWPCSDSPFLVVCTALETNAQIRLLSVCVLALAVIVCVLCMLSCLLVVLVHKLSNLWVKSLIRPIAVPATTEPVTDDPRKALLQETKSSLRDPTSSKAEGKKKKKASFAEEDDGTSCAAARDVDEEDL